MSRYNKGNQRDGMGISLFPGGLRGRPYRGGRGNNRFYHGDRNQNNQTNFEDYYYSDDDDLFYENQNQTFETIDLDNNWNEFIDEFEKIGLNQDLYYCVQSLFEFPTKVQSLCIRPIGLHRNILVQSQSYSGKTTALCIGVLQNIDIEEKNTQALILTPNRINAFYIHECLVKFGKKMNDLQISVFVNDISIEKQREEANKLPHIVVATPGRALRLIQNNFLKLDQLKMICFDEVDEFVSRGQINKVQQLLTFIKPEIQVLVFSSIIPIPFFRLIEPLMTDPVKIKVEEEPCFDKIKQYFVNAHKTEFKFPTLIDLYGRFAIHKSIIFASKKDEIYFLEESLRNCNFEVAAFSNRFGHKKLEEEINKFKCGTRVMVSMDIPKGFSFPTISLVFSYDLPPTIDTFLERVKRSVSLGAKNIIYICNEEDMKKLNEYKMQIPQKIEELPDNFNE